MHVESDAVGTRFPKPPCTPLGMGTGANSFRVVKYFDGQELGVRRPGAASDVPGWWVIARLVRTW